jgi:hypothetical protein
MPQWPKDNQAARNAFYGDPGKGQISAQMVPVVPPFAMYYDGKRVKAIQFHKKAAPYLLAAFNEIWEYCGHDQAKVDASGASKYAGAYNHRMVRGSSTKWSNHAYATAIDLNAGENALGVKKGTMPQFIVDAFCRQGAMWGGWYQSRPDWMHFEFVDNGGRKPKSLPPGIKPAKPAALIASDAPADEFDDHPPLPSFLSKKDDPVIVDGDVNGDPELYSVQKRLKAMNYSPGVLDGVWGGGTSGALGGFINDRGGHIPVPASLDAFNDVREAIKAELGRAESETPRFTRPVSAARKAGDAATVAAIEPAVVPIKQNFLLTAWASFIAGLTAVWTQIKDYVSAAWDWYTDNSESGIFTTISEYVSMVPTVVWIVAVAIGLGYIALNSRAGVNKITESVSSGARQ